MFAAILAGLALFALLSAILQRWPTLLHPAHGIRHSRIGQIRLISHRGGKLVFAENTLAAFAHALATGCNCIEFDLWLTRDGHTVIHHDPTFARLSGDERRISECTLAELPRLSDERVLAARVNQFGISRAEQGTLLPPEGVGSDRWLRTIPELKDVLDLVSNWPLSAPSDEEVPGFSSVAKEQLAVEPAVLLEFKVNDEEMIRHARTMVDAFGLSKRAFWFSLIASTNAALRRSADFTGMASLPTVSAFNDQIVYVWLWIFGLLPFVSMPDAVFAFPVGILNFAGVRRFRAADILPDWFVRVMLCALKSSFHSAALCDHIKRRGMITTVLIVNSVDDLETARNIGVDCFLTDDSTLLRELTDSELRSGLGGAPRAAAAAARAKEA
jgi:glycerophosphoryl diester phosphodiesterase